MTVEPIRWRGEALELLDQRLLPREVLYVACRDAHEVAVAIRDMIVRGAPAIGVSAAFGIALAARRGDDIDAAAAELRSSRPTAVNLMWALDRMLRARDAGRDLTAEAEAMFAEDVEANKRIGRHGAMLLGESPTILTHCNAGALATAGYGTALGVIRAAVEAGKRVAVFADETRPYLQGARLTAWELKQENIDVTLITDSMAGHFFQQGKFDAVIVGADRIAANGDTANKIGTYGLAVLAAHHGIPLYVVAPTSTVDLATPTGAGIPIEERSPDEITTRFAARNPAFDVTPAALIAAIVTEEGIHRAPYVESLAVVVV
jgi:methylthioribose-1-phosphate isomerase